MLIRDSFLTLPASSEKQHLNKSSSESFNNGIVTIIITNLALIIEFNQIIFNILVKANIFSILDSILGVLDSILGILGAHIICTYSY